MKRSTLLETIDVGKTIKKLREERGLSQEDLANGICDRTNITKLENGHSKIPSLSFVLLLCDRLEITIQDFLNLATKNHYALDRKKILEMLMNRDFTNLEKFLNTIDSELLLNRDKHYFLYLSSINMIQKSDKESAIRILNSLATEHLENDYIKMMTDCTLKLLKNQVINTNIIDYNGDDEMLYLIDIYLNHLYEKGDLKNAKYYLSKEISFINSHSLNKYLPIYYKNKIMILKDDYNKKKEIENKLAAISKLNK